MDKAVAVRRVWQVIAVLAVMSIIGSGVSSCNKALFGPSEPPKSGQLQQVATQAPVAATPQIVLLGPNKTCSTDRTLHYFATEEEDKSVFNPEAKCDPLVFVKNRCLWVRTKSGVKSRLCNTGGTVEFPDEVVAAWSGDSTSFTADVALYPLGYWKALKQKGGNGSTYFVELGVGKR